MVAAVYYIMSATVIIIIRSEGGYSASRKYRVLLLKLAPHSQNFDTVNKLLGSSLEVMSSQYFSEREREREREMMNAGRSLKDTMSHNELIAVCLSRRETFEHMLLT